MSANVWSVRKAGGRWLAIQMTESGWRAQMFVTWAEAIEHATRRSPK